MGISISSASRRAVDTTKTNPTGVIYLFGDEVTDGSIRDIFDVDDGIMHRERRADGVWSDTGLHLRSEKQYYDENLGPMLDNDLNPMYED